MNLVLLLLLPVITAIGILSVKGNAVRRFALAGAALQLLLSLVLLYQYEIERVINPGDAFLFQSNYSWFPSLHINFLIGVDGISIAMIVLTAVVVFAGVLVSWNM